MLCNQSPPVRGRGLKRAMVEVYRMLHPVAPRAGAWIETVKLQYDQDAFMSPPVRGRGLKLSQNVMSRSGFDVAPRAGAWIETI